MSKDIFPLCCFISAIHWLKGAWVRLRFQAGSGLFFACFFPEGVKPERMRENVRSLQWVGFLFFFVFFCSQSVGCQRSADVENDFTLAEKAYKQKEIADAEMHYLRFLRKNPENEKRWYVWQQLLDISLNFRQDKETARSYLEIMQEEFLDNPLLRRRIILQLADISADLRAWPQAIVLWESLADDPATPAEEKAVVYQKLSAAYLRRLEFLQGMEALESCLRLPVKEMTKLDCLYDLGAAKSLTGEFSDAAQHLEKLVSTPDVDSEHLVLAVFLLADVYEQMEKYDQAQKLFESIRGTYPNQQVISLRLQYLHKKLKKK